MVRYLKIGMLLVAAAILMPSVVSAQSKAGTTDSVATAEDPNDKSEQDRSFEETRKHMHLHSEWSKKTGKMNDK